MNSATEKIEAWPVPDIEKEGTSSYRKQTMRLHARAVPKGNVAAVFAMETEPLLKREGSIVYCMERGGYRVPSLKCRDFGVYSMSKTSSR